MEQNIYSIYKHTNIVNGKCYIGKTTRGMETRWKQHIATTMSGISNTPFHHAIRKYGKENFIGVVIATTTDDKMVNYLERFYIKVYKSKNPKYGYNRTDGGDGSSGMNISEKTRQKMSDATEKYIVCQFTLQNIFISQFSSLKEAGTTTKINPSNIRRCCSGTHWQAGDFRWCRLGEEYMLDIPKKIKYPGTYINSVYRGSLSQNTLL